MIRRLPALLLLLAACAPPTRFVHPTADFGAMRNVAILPFDSLTNDKLCAERVQKVFFTELLATGAFQVIEPGQVAFIMRRDRINGDQLSPEDLKKLGQSLKADGFFVGTVIEYDDGRGGAVPTPRVKLSLRLIEAASGETMWAASPARVGATVSARLFGIGGAPASVIAEELIREELARLTR